MEGQRKIFMQDQKKTAPTEMGTNQMTQEETNGQTQNLALSVRPPSGLVSGKVSVTQVAEGGEGLQKPNNEFQLIHQIRGGCLQSAIRGILGTLWGDWNMG